MNYFQYNVYCPICSSKVELFDNYCSVCGYCLTATIEEDDYVTEWGDNTTGNTSHGFFTCPKCGLLYLGEGGCPVCDSSIKELPTNSTPTNAELRDKINEIIRRLK